MIYVLLKNSYDIILYKFSIEGTLIWNKNISTEIQEYYTPRPMWGIHDFMFLNPSKDKIAIVYYLKNDKFTLYTCIYSTSTGDLISTIKIPTLITRDFIDIKWNFDDIIEIHTTFQYFIIDLKNNINNIYILFIYIYIRVDFTTLIFI